MTVPSDTPGAINGGLRKEIGTDVKERTTSVNGFVCAVQVENIDEILEKVTSNGGEILMPKMHMESLGEFASYLDSEGNCFSVMQADK